MQKIAVSISIVHYKKYSLTRSCLQSIFASKTKLNIEVIVVDNDEREKIKSKLSQEFPTVRYIKSKENRGYGAGNNAAFRISKGKYFFVLNPDTVVHTRAIDTLHQFLETHKKVAIAAPQLLDEKGQGYTQLPSKRLTPLRGIVTLSFLNKVVPQRLFNRGNLETNNSEGIQYVDAVPGSALMMRSEVFRKIGMYDERFFLYFEESDIGKRIQDNGYKLAVVKKAHVTHLWGMTTKGDTRASKAFSQSRYRYFKKHYGVVWALIVEGFAKYSKWTFSITLLTILAFVLRFYDFSDRMTFHGELGHNYLVAREYIEKAEIPLVGPPTSHPWLDFGPLFYWLIIPVLALSQFNPMIANGFITLLHVLLPIVSFYSMKKLLGNKVALIQAILLTISPLIVNFSREARFFSLTLLLMYPFIYFFLQKRYFYAGILFSVILNFHLTPTILLPVVFIYLVLNGKNQIKQFAYGFLIPQIPYLMHCLLFDREQIVRLMLWFPYRVLGFLGFVPENTLTTEVIQGNTSSLTKFLSSSIISQDNLVSTIFILFVIIYYYKMAKGSLHRFIKLIFTTGLVAIFIHGNPPEHYYLPLIPFLFIIISAVFARFQNNVVAMLILVIFAVNLSYYTGPDLRFENGLVPYKTQVTVIEDIQREVGDNKYWIRRSGPFDQFEDDYAQNYLYLADYLGQKPTRDAEREVTIFEEGKTIRYEKNY